VVSAHALEAQTHLDAITLIQLRHTQHLQLHILRRLMKSRMHLPTLSPLILIAQPLPPGLQILHHRTRRRRLLEAPWAGTSVQGLNLGNTVPATGRNAPAAARKLPAAARKFPAAAGNFPTASLNSSEQSMLQKRCIFEL